MSGTILDAFAARAGALAEKEAFRALLAGGAEREVGHTWGEWERAATNVATALIGAGHAPGERVAILAGNRPVWPIADLGILMAGMVSVGVYPTSAPGQVGQVLRDCGAVAIIVDTAAQLEKVLAVRAGLPALRTLVAPQGTPGAGVTGWEEWLAGGAASKSGDVAHRIASAGPDDAALIIYTSGSTGDPKGAILTHRYLTASALAIQSHLGLTEADTSLSFLPYCHAAERVFGLYTRIVAGMSFGLVSEHAHLADAARGFHPTLFGGLPRHFEKAVELLRGSGPEAGLALYFGDRVRLATCGGASFPADAARYLKGRGLEVLGAYGLTEHLCVSMHRPGQADYDTAGTQVGGTKLRVADDGELLVRKSELTFAGYFGRPGETAGAFTEDGQWLLTGDLGTVDAQGRVRVTGRKKELIALSTGKKVAPLAIEARLAQESWIAQAVLYGESRPFVTALLSPRRAAVQAWAKEAGVTERWPMLLEHIRVRAELQAAVDRVNAGLSRPEQVRAFVLLDRELQAEHDELTPTLKLRRSAIAEQYRHRLDALYGRS